MAMAFPLLGLLNAVVMVLLLDEMERLWYRLAVAAQVLKKKTKLQPKFRLPIVGRAPESGASRYDERAESMKLM